MWPQAESALELAYRLAPENPTVLNYLGYARLERGEKVEEAEALIQEVLDKQTVVARLNHGCLFVQYFVLCRITVGNNP